MSSSIPNVVADFSTVLALKVAIGATTATLVSATDSDGVALPTGTYGFTIDRKNSSKEYITCTLTGTALTAISTIAVGTGVATSGFAKAHRRSAEVVLTDFVAIKRIQDVLETGYPVATTPTTSYQLATKKYVDDLALGGSTTVDKVTVVATCGENVSAGNLVYLKASDSKWWKADADLVATIDNVVLGIAQGAGTTNGLITSGVLVKGVDANQSGLTASSIYYASNTAGAISLTSGTITRVIGIATATTKLYFDPDFNKTYKNYAADAVGTDSYAITLQSAFGAYYEGMQVTFKAATANTGAATLAVNGLSAITIKKNVSSDLATGDILANQIVKLVYDGTNFQLMTPRIFDAATQLTGLLPVANQALAAYTQEIPLGGSSVGYLNGGTTNTDGTIMVLTCTGATLRLARDATTGSYQVTHSVASVGGSAQGVVILGSFVYTFFDNGTNLGCTRLALADLTGSTNITFGTVISCSGSGGGQAWTDGTFFYVISTQVSTSVHKLSISGTALTEVSTATAASSGLVSQQNSGYFDGANVYIVQGQTPSTIHKLTAADGSTETTSSYNLTQYENGDSGSTNSMMIAPIDATRIYIGKIEQKYNATTTTAYVLHLIPIAKP